MVKGKDYISFGRGKKTLIMIQGLNTRGIQGSAFLLSLMYRLFTKEYTVYLFERRKDLFDGITVRDFAADIANAMDTLNLTQADVFGVSQGGMIAQYLAIDRPDLVNKLVLACTLSKNNVVVEEAIERWISLTRQAKMKELILDMTYRMYSDAYIKRYKFFLPVLTLLQKPKDIERFILLAKSCLTCNAYDELHNITCPVFVIGGKKDHIVGGKASAEIADKLSCSMYMYETLGHAAYEEAEDFNQKVLHFFKNNV